MTPEGKVKVKVKRILNLYENMYYFMPVQTGYGSPTLDILGFHDGRGFAIETKAAGKKLTKRQEVIATEIKQSCAPVFVIDGTPESFNELIAWLDNSRFLC